jgi:CHAD domain-containing protein
LDNGFSRNGDGESNGKCAGNSSLEACRERVALEAVCMVRAAGKETTPHGGPSTRDAAGAGTRIDHVESQIAMKLAAVLEIADRLAKAEANAISGARRPSVARWRANARKSPSRPKAQGLRIVSIVDDQRRVIVRIAGSGAAQAAKAVNLPGIWGRAIFRPIACAAQAAKGGKRGARERQDARRGGSYCGKTEFAQAGRIIIRRQVEHILTRRYAAGYLDDPEYVHEMRVATRRMRAAIRVFEDVLELGRLQTQIGNLADVLGHARDLDVFLEFLREYRDGCKGARQAFADEMMRFWNARRRTSYRKVSALMGSAAFGAFIGHAHKTFCLPVGSKDGPQATSAAWNDPLWRQARAILHRQLRKMFRYEPDLEKYSPRKQHRLRIAGKRMRYLTEFFLPLYGPQMTELIDYVKDVQAFLGDSHDSEIFIDQTREYARSRSDGVADKSKPLVRSLQQRGRRSLSKAIKVWRKLRSRPTSDKFMRLVDSPGRK